MPRLAARLFIGLAVVSMDLYILYSWTWFADTGKYWNEASMPAYLMTVIALLITIWYIRWLLHAAVPPLTREDCPHFNVDGDRKCNLLPEPSECKGYCRTLTVYEKE